MNKDRRTRLEKAVSLMETAYAIIDEVANEERDAYDNMPEGLQASERGEQMEEFAGMLEEIAEALDEAISNTDDVITG